MQVSGAAFNSAFTPLQNRNKVTQEELNQAGQSQGTDTTSVALKSQKESADQFSNLNFEKYDASQISANRNDHMVDIMA